MTEQIDRKVLIEQSINFLTELARSIETDLAHDSAFIERNTALLPQLWLAKKDVEQQIAMRSRRVNNMRIAMRTIAFCLELLEKEQKQVQS